MKSFIKALLSDITTFSRAGIRTHPLRPYQIAPVEAVLRSIREDAGHQFAWVFSRQSGKDETKAQLYAFLLAHFQFAGGQIVEANPTFKPQCLTAKGRLLDRARACVLTRKAVGQEGYKVRLGKARVVFLSAEPNANVRGETASVLLVCNEMQDVAAAKWEAEFVPMAASTNATRLYVGTVKTSRTLLAQKVRALRAMEREDGIQRVFMIDWEQVARDNPAYGRFVEEEIRTKGIDHPSIMTEFRLLEIDAEGGMFPPRRRDLMRGAHARQHAPCAGTVYAALLDVGGEDEGATTGELRREKRDYTCCHIVAVDLAGLHDPLVGRPSYRLVHTRTWHGTRATGLLAQIRAFVEPWNPRVIVADATGVGQALVSFLGSAAAFGERVVPFVFTATSKAALGSGFLAVVETVRFKHYADDDEDARAFWREAEHTQYSVPEGEGAIDRRMRWGVPDGTRDGATGEWVHDDRIIAAALCAVLDEQEWNVYQGGGTVTTGDKVLGIGF
jgi:hypothetical protein